MKFTTSSSGKIAVTKIILTKIIIFKKINRSIFTFTVKALRAITEKIHLQVSKKNNLRYLDGLKKTSFYEFI